MLRLGYLIVGVGFVYFLVYFARFNTALKSINEQEAKEAAEAAGTNPTLKPKLNETHSEPPDETEAWARDYSSKTIPGLMPADVYLNLTSQGFSKTGPTKLLYGYEWTLERSKSGFDYRVRIAAPDVNSVRVVEATCLNSSRSPTDDGARWFLEYVSTLPYQGADPPAAQAWVRDNLETNAQATFGGVHFSLSGSGRARILRISANAN